MNAIEIFNIIAGFFPYGFIKITVLIITGMYLIFAAVILRQETLMSRVVEIPYSPLLRFIALLHMVGAISVFVLAFVLL